MNLRPSFVVPTPARISVRQQDEGTAHILGQMFPTHTPSPIVSTPPKGAYPAGLLTCVSKRRSGLPGLTPVACSAVLTAYSCGGSCSLGAQGTALHSLLLSGRIPKPDCESKWQSLGNRSTLLFAPFAPRKEDPLQQARLPDALPNATGRWSGIHRGGPEVLHERPERHHRAVFTREIGAMPGLRSSDLRAAKPIFQPSTPRQHSPETFGPVPAPVCPDRSRRQRTGYKAAFDIRGERAHCSLEAPGRDAVG